jgi:hypothetical protein
MSAAFPTKTMYKLSGRRVLLWKDYGAVAPSLWTTNGHFGFVSQLTAESVLQGQVVTDSVLGLGSRTAFLPTHLPCSSRSQRHTSSGRRRASRMRTTRGASSLPALTVASVHLSLVMIRPRSGRALHSCRGLHCS